MWADSTRYARDGLVCTVDHLASSAGVAALRAGGSAADAARLRAEGHARMPFRGDIRTVTVPGCVDGWLAAGGVLRRPRLGAALVEIAAEGRDAWYGGAFGRGRSGTLTSCSRPATAGSPGLPIRALAPAMRKGRRGRPCDKGTLCT